VTDIPSTQHIYTHTHSHTHITYHMCDWHSVHTTYLYRHTHTQSHISHVWLTFRSHVGNVLYSAHPQDGRPSFKTYHPSTQSQFIVTKLCFTFRWRLEWTGMNYPFLCLTYTIHLPFENFYIYQAYWHFSIVVCGGVVQGSYHVQLHTTRRSCILYLFYL